MSAVPANVVDFKLPKRKPKVIEKEPLPDQRKYAVVPFAALSDKRLHHLSIRVLGLICSYANRAGITWVGQTRIGTHLGISKQAVNKAVSELKKAGYLEVVSKGFRAERADTLRIIFDPSLSAQDAIAVTSGIEDTRPPEQIKREEELRNIMADNDLPDLSPEQIKANMKRLEALLGTLGRPSNFRTHQPQTLGAIMQETKPAVARKGRPKKVNLSVDQEKPTIVNQQVDHVVKDSKAELVNHQVDNVSTKKSDINSQPMVNLEVDLNTKNIGIERLYKVYELNKKGLIKDSDMKWAALAVEVGVTESEMVAAMSKVDTLAEACKLVLDARGL
jgi:hypothetical protein